MPAPLELNRLTPLSTERARVIPPLSEDPHEAIVQLMAEVIRQGRRVDRFGLDLRAALDEWREERQTLLDERPALAHAASTRASNRVAGLIGALALLYSQAAPILHEIWKAFHQ